MHCPHCATTHLFIDIHTILCVRFNSVSTYSIVLTDNTSRAHMILFTVYVIMYTHDVNNKKINQCGFSLYTSLYVHLHIYAFPQYKFLPLKAKGSPSVQRCV